MGATGKTTLNSFNYTNDMVFFYLHKYHENHLSIKYNMKGIAPDFYIRPNLYYNMFSAKHKWRYM